MSEDGWSLLGDDESEDGAGGASGGGEPGGDPWSGGGADASSGQSTEETPAYCEEDPYSAEAWEDDDGDDSNWVEVGSDDGGGGEPNWVETEEGGSGSSNWVEVGNGEGSQGDETCEEKTPMEVCVFGEEEFSSTAPVGSPAEVCPLPKKKEVVVLHKTVVQRVTTKEPKEPGLDDGKEGALLKLLGVTAAPLPSPQESEKFIETKVDYVDESFVLVAVHVDKYVEEKYDVHFGYYDYIVTVTRTYRYTWGVGSPGQTPALTQNVTGNGAIWR